MVCIYCRNELSVSNSRPQKRSNQTWRRRPCKTCGAVFTSTEALSLAQAISVRKNGALAPFDRDKLFVSIYESLRHRPTAVSDARELSNTVVAYIMFHAEHGSITTRAIFDAALNTIQYFDKAGATHYAAFHPQPSQIG